MDQTVRLSKLKRQTSRVTRVAADTPLKLKEDNEIQEWGRDLATPKENGGAGNSPTGAVTFHSTANLVIAAPRVVFVNCELFCFLLQAYWASPEMGGSTCWTTWS